MHFVINPLGEDDIVFHSATMATWFIIRGIEKCRATAEKENDSRSASKTRGPRSTIHVRASVDKTENDAQA